MNTFQHIFLEDALWQQLSSLRLSRDLKNLITKIEGFYENSILDGHGHSENISSIDGGYKIRFRGGDRIPFKIYHQNEELCLILGRIHNHHEGSQLHERGGYQFTADVEFDLQDNNIGVIEKSACNHFSQITRIWTPEDQERIINNAEAELRLVLNQAQKTFIDKPGPLLLKGTAGSGKTTVSIYRLLKSLTENKIYVTYTPGLQKYAQKIFKSLSANLEEQKVEFLTIEQLCLNLVAVEGNFSHKQKMTFEIFKKLHFIERAVTQSRVEAYIIWEEIRGVLKQSEHQLSRQEYLKITESGQIGGVVYKVYLDYVEYLESRRMWDDIDLAKAALKVAEKNQHHRYDEIIVDEIQDLTKIHFRLFTYLVNSLDGLFLAGDESQAIHPSKFAWKEVETIIKNSQNQYTKIPRLYQALNENYRNPESIFKLAKALKDWRSQFMNDSAYDDTQKIHKQGGEPVYLISPENFTEFSIDLAPTHVMVIVISEEHRAEASKIFGKGSVFTVAEAKGLENKNIILYKFFEDRHVHHSLQTLLNFLGVPARLRSYKTLLNLLHVAITRSEARLFIISDHQNVRLIPPLREFTFSENDCSELKELLTSGQEAPEKYFQWAQKVEDSGNWQQAKEYYQKAASLGHNKGEAYANKCQGLIAKAKNNYQKAVEYFELALNIIEDLSLLKEFYECQGCLALEKKDIKAASDYFLSAEMSPMNIVNIICTGNDPEKYNRAFEIVLKHSPKNLRGFLDNPQAANSVSLSIAEAGSLCKNVTIVNEYYAHRLSIYQNQLTKYQRNYQSLDKVIESKSGILSGSKAVNFHLSRIVNNLTKELSLHIHPCKKLVIGKQPMRELPKSKNILVRQMRSLTSY